MVCYDGKKKKEVATMKLWQKILSLVLVLMILAGITACGVTPPTTQPSQTGSTAPTQQTSPTIPTTVITQPTTTQAPPPKPEPLVYTLIQEDVDLFYSLLEQCETLSLIGLDMDAIDAISAEVDEQFAYLNEQSSIAYVLYCVNVKDDALQEQYLSASEICTQAYDAYIEMTRRVYLSDTPAKDVLFEGWTEAELEQLLNYDEEIALLRQRNEEIRVEYQVVKHDSLRIPLYIEFVQNNNKIAQYYGYDNYYDYAFELEYGRDYTPETLEQMRQYGRDYMAPVFETARRNFVNTFYSLNADNQERVINFLNNDYKQVGVNYVSLYLESLPDTMSDTMNQMLTMDSYFIRSANGRAGAFTTMIGDRSFCFFGPGYGNSTTVIHEAGHYYASRYADLGSMSLDLAETHSQGNEWLFAHFIREYMPSSQHEAFVNYRLYNDLSMTLVAMMVDEFEQRVYTTDISNYTAEDFDKLMRSVATQYFTEDYLEEFFPMDVNEYWRAVVVEQPVYYISYAVSAITSIDLYTVAVEDFAEATRLYQKLCEEPDLDQGFLGNIRAAGLSGPFDESFYQELVEIINSRAQ